MRDSVLVLGASRADSARTDALIGQLVARERELANLVRQRARAVSKLASERARAEKRAATPSALAAFYQATAAQATAEVLERTGGAQLELLRAAIRAREIGNDEAFSTLVAAFDALSDLGARAPGRLEPQGPRPLGATRFRAQRLGRVRLGRSLGASISDFRTYNASDICPDGRPCDLSPGPRPASARELALYNWIVERAPLLPWGIGGATYAALRSGSLDFQRYTGPDGVLYSKYLKASTGVVTIQRTGAAFSAAAFEDAYDYVVGAVQTTVETAQAIVNAACEITSSGAVQAAAGAVGGPAVGAVAKANASTCTRATTSSDGASSSAAGAGEKKGFSFVIPLGLAALAALAFA